MGRSIGGTAWSGLAFVMLLFMSSAFSGGDLFGGFGDPDGFFVEYYADESQQLIDVLGGHLLVAAGLALLLFMVHLVRGLRSAIGESADLDAAALSSAVASSMLLAGAAALTVVAFAKSFGGAFGDEALTSPAVALAPQLGYVLVFMAAMWAMAFAIGLIVHAVWRTQIWPRWLRRLSVVTCVLLPFSAVGFMPVVLLPVWVLAVSVWARGEWTASTAAGVATAA